MKIRFKLIFAVVAFFAATINYAQTTVSMMSTNDAAEFYQIKTYLFANKEQEIQTDLFLEKAYLPAIKKQGFKNIGVFKNRLTTTDTIRKTIVLVPFESWEQLLAVDGELLQDEIFNRDAKLYWNAPHDKPNFRRVETVILKAFKDHPFLTIPKLTSKKQDRVYELRSYESATDKLYQSKVDMFNAGGEIKLFDKLGFNAVFYGEVIAGPKMPNLMYMTSFENQESRDMHWKNFGEAAEWKQLQQIEKYKNTVSHIDISFLYPTSFSDF